MTARLNYLHSWIGRIQAEREFLSPRLAQQLATGLAYEGALRAGGPLPARWHRALVPHIVAQSNVSAHGHSKRSGVIPQVPMPRHTWVGSRVRFGHPLVVASEVICTSHDLYVAAKKGHTGNLPFVSLRHEREDLEGPLICEEQDVVYRESATTTYTAAPDHRAGGLSPGRSGRIRYCSFAVSPTLFNGHRLRHDCLCRGTSRLSGAGHPHDTDHEVVGRSPAAQPSRKIDRFFSFKAVRPCLFGPRFISTKPASPDRPK